MGYISQQALVNLRKYAYKSVDKYVNFFFSRRARNEKFFCQVTDFELCFRSILDLVRDTVAKDRGTQHGKHLLELWTYQCSSDACQITLSGLAIVLANFTTLIYYDPHFLTDKEDAPGPPQWVYFTWVTLQWLNRHEFILLETRRWAVGLFAYQSFDAIDGKQARRTGMAGPLGEMFDHGTFLEKKRETKRLADNSCRMRCYKYHSDYHLYLHNIPIWRSSS